MPVPILITTTSSWPAATPRAPLPEGQDVDVVVDPDRGARSAAAKRVADRVAVPAGHDRWRDRPAGLELDRARDARSRSPRGGRGWRWVVREQQVEELVDPVEADARVRPRSGPARRGGRGSARRASSAATSMLVAPRSATRTCPASRPERQLARRPAAGARADVTLDDQTALDELADPLRHDGPAETGPGDQLRARPRAPQADLVEDHDERVEGLVRQRRAKGRDVIRCRRDDTPASNAHRATFALDRSK